MCLLHGDLGIFLSLLNNMGCLRLDFMDILLCKGCGLMDHLICLPLGFTNNCLGLGFYGLNMLDDLIRVNPNLDVNGPLVIEVLLSSMYMNSR